MKKILVVEDNPIIVSAYRNKLQAEGLRVESALEGEAALEAIEAQTPDLVLLDLMLPGLSGAEVLRRLRSQPACKDLPVVVFTQTHSPERMQEAWDAGATQVLSKATTTPKKVVEVVKQTLAAADR